jgi:hypothetical protein
MTRTGSYRVWLAIAALAAGAGAVIIGGSGAHAAPPVPSIRVLTGGSHIELDRFGHSSRLYLPDAVYVAAVNGPFEIDASRRHHHVVLHQVVRSAGHVRVVRRIKPPSRVQMRSGLPGFLKLRLETTAGTPVATTTVDFCPSGGFDEQRVSPDSPANPTFPEFCGDKLTHAMIWGIDRGWADTMFAQIRASRSVAPDGTYLLDASITRSYAAQLHVPAADRDAKLLVDLVTDGGCGGGCPQLRADRRAMRSQSALGARAGSARPATARALPVARIDSGLPDLIALPAHDLVIRHERKSGSDYLGFGATIWNAGPGTFDIEGFRRGDRPTMTARQFISRPGHGTTSVRIGRFEFDTRKGHHHWHLEDVARYTLLNASGNTVVRSHKQSFCLAPTDPVNLTLPHANWNPDSVGLESSCPDDQSIWLRETLPVGWGDTYVQEAGGQAFNITGVANGRYVVRVQTNPFGNIHEVTRSNNTSYLAVHLGGTPGARTLTVVGPVPAP